METYKQYLCLKSGQTEEQENLSESALLFCFSIIYISPQNLLYSSGQIKLHVIYKEIWFNTKKMTTQVTTVLNLKSREW